MIVECTKIATNNCNCNAGLIIEWLVVNLPLEGIIKSKSSQSLEIKVATSIWNWGQFVAVVISDDEILISCRSANPMQLFDCGRNRKNIESISTVVQKWLRKQFKSPP